MSTEKSTNVRIQEFTAPPEVRAIGFGLRAVGAVSTEIAASLAEQLFYRAPKRRPTLPREAAVLARGVHRKVPAGRELLSTWTFGEGPRVVLMHGWGGSAAQLSPLVDPLVRAGFSVIAFDVQGHGQSSGTTSTMVNFAAGLAEVARLDGIEARAVVAHSVGSAGVMIASAGGTHFDRAVFIAPPSDPNPWYELFSRSLALPPRVKTRTRERIEDTLGARFDDLTARSLGPRFSSPLLVVHDRLDKEVPWIAGEDVAESVPHGAIVSTEGLGHKRILSDPKVIESVVRFVAGDRDQNRATLDCRGCGASLQGHHELCPRCVLAEELFDREKRWAKLGLS